jgi:hypothetical protein
MNQNNALLEFLLEGTPGVQVEFYSLFFAPGVIFIDIKKCQLKRLGHEMDWSFVDVHK